jgi:ABC-type transport system involved in cytochrome c biogenesis permease subunit
LFYQWRWIVYYSNGLSILFMTVNLLHPENFSKELLPALQSIWFIPHVIVYIFSYALFGIATLISIHFLFFDKTKSIDNWIKTDRMIEIAFAFLTLGLLFGALWAKQAWGHYWTWDPKEVWALITWCIYLLYLHYRHGYPGNYNISAKILIIAFILLLVCWLGIHFLPIAQQSIHTYGTN